MLRAHRVWRGRVGKAMVVDWTSSESTGVAPTVNASLDHKLDITRWKKRAFKLFLATIDDLVVFVRRS